jgi:hypothetical protein
MDRADSLGECGQHARVTVCLIERLCARTLRGRERRGVLREALNRVELLQHPC